MGGEVGGSDQCQSIKIKKKVYFGQMSFPLTKDHNIQYPQMIIYIIDIKCLWLCITIIIASLFVTGHTAFKYKALI